MNRLEAQRYQADLKVTAGEVLEKGKVQAKVRIPLAA